MTESTVHTQRVYAVSKPLGESSVVHTQRVYAVSKPPAESSVVHTQRVYIVSVDPSVLLQEVDFAGGGNGDGSAAAPSAPTPSARPPSPSSAPASSVGGASGSRGPTFTYNRKQDENVVLRAKNATSRSESPFTYKQQVFKHPGERWEVDITIPSSRRDSAQEWAARLVALKGRSGTILVGDPDHATPVGTATSMTISGNAGDDTITVNSLDGTLKAGDHFQLGSGSESRLHMVLVDKSSGSGTLEIWPVLRTNYSSASATLSNPKGTFRLASNVTEWSINNASIYGISFSAVEDLT